MEAQFEELIHGCHGMLSASETSDIREFLAGGQYALALEALCESLVDDNKRVSVELYTRIHTLVQQLDGVDPYVVERLREVDRHFKSVPRARGPNVTVGGMTSRAPRSPRTICQFPSCTILWCR